MTTKLNDRPRLRLGRGSQRRFCVAAALTALALVCCSITGNAEDRDRQLSVMTFNIRYGTAQDGENSWEYRREHVFDVIRKHDTDIAGLQEVLVFQLDELLAALPGYASIGIGRNADFGWEGSYILYRTDRLTPLASGTFWLSETPAVPCSVSWDSALCRICTWGWFYDKHCKRTFYLFNTHFDHRGQQARLESARLITERIGARYEDSPVIITGDFNCGEESAPVQLITQEYADSFRLVKPKAGEAGTFNGWQNKRDGAKIDYVFVGDGVAVLDADIIFDTYDGRTPSDHFPVYAVVEVE